MSPHEVISPIVHLSKELVKADVKYGLDSGYIVESGEWTDSEQSIVESPEEDNQEYSYELGPQLKQFNDDLQKREEILKLDRQRNLLYTQLQHLKKNVNILVIGPDHAGKTSLINSLAYMIRKKDGEIAWRSAASYDLGKKYKFKQIQLWPEHRVQKTPRVTFYEAGGFSKIKEMDKAATILQYAMEGRLEGRISSLLQMFLLMNIQDITERYREDPQDPRLLINRKIDAVIHVASADSEPDKALFNLLKTAVNKSKDPCVKKIPILTCVTSPHDAVEEPVCPLSEYDLAAHVKKSQDRKHKSSKLHEPRGVTIEPASVRHITYYRPAFDPLSDETDPSNIRRDQAIDRPLLTLFEESLRLAAREPQRPMYKAIYKNVAAYIAKHT